MGRRPLRAAKTLLGGEWIRKWKKPQKSTEKTEERNGFDGFAVGEFLRFSQNIRIENRYLSVEEGKQVITTRAVSFVLGIVSFYDRARGDDGGTERNDNARVSLSAKLKYSRQKRKRPPAPHHGYLDRSRLRSVR